MNRHSRPILVTGAFGNLGIHVLDALLRSSRRVLAVDLATPKTRARARRFRSEHGAHLETVWLDLRDREAVARVVVKARPSAIIHLAAVLPPFSEAPDAPVDAVNRGGTAALLAAAHSAGLHTRFVLASSYSVYGAQHPGAPGPDGAPAPKLLDADTPTAPVDAYGRSKLAAEQAVRASGLPAVILRLGAVIPFEGGLESMLTLRMLFEVPWDGLRHAIDPRDAALAFARACEAPDAVGRVLLIGGDPSFRGQHGPSVSEQLVLRGLPAAEFETFSPPSARAEDYFTEGWMDTREAEAVLGFQRHTRADYEATVRERMGVLRHVTPLASGAVRSFMRGLSPYRNGAPPPRDPLQTRLRALHRTHADRALVHSECVSPLPASELRAQLDEPGWDEWSSFLTTLKVESATPGRASKARGTLGLALPGGLSAPVPVELLTLTRSELRWRGGIPGIFQGEHYLRFQPVEDGTRIAHGERFTGALGARVGAAARPLVDALYQREAQGLAARVRAAQSPRAVALPGSEEELSPAWLEAVLRERHPTTRVAEVSLAGSSHAGDGLASTADRIKLRARYSENPDGLREDLLLKTIFLGSGARVGPASLHALSMLNHGVTRLPAGGHLQRKLFHGLTRFQERFPQAPDAMYENEVRFYREIRPTLEIETPAAYAAVRHPSSRGFFVLMEDLGTRGAHFPSALESLTPDAMAGLLQTLAALHARHWQSPALRGALAWVPTSTSGGMFELFDGIGLELIRAQLQLYPFKAELISPLGRDLDSLWKTMWDVQRAMRTQPMTLLHGDVHIGNTYTLPRGPGGLLDWQLMMRGCWAHDVAYVIATGLSTETRRAHEGALIAHYCAELAGHGVHNPPTPDEAFELYRRAVSWGLVIGWLITPPQNYGEALTSANIARLVAAAQDLDTFGGAPQ
ncbi:MAG: NAD-dependent epimerase/dehydratase family protein [Myxococcales bacterium]|nr:NAD-dependent epimerase/dehydratase family protein [Myxococcales bacterium]MCB9626987.1 NAD-dependent epimerase/dehydratase family protein [Sandaracinaceae bacterium]